MKMLYRGSLYIGNKDFHYISDNCITFKDLDRDTTLLKDDMKEWVICLNSPWSDRSVKYEIKKNCEQYSENLRKNEPLWKCEYSVVGYEATTATCVGYGRDETEAFIDCQRLFRYLQKKYNPLGEAF